MSALDQFRTAEEQVAKRLGELMPLVAEYHELEQVARRLGLSVGDDAPAASTRPPASTEAGRRRRCAVKAATRSAASKHDGSADGGIGQPVDESSRAPACSQPPPAAHRPLRPRSTQAPADNRARADGSAAAHWSRTPTRARSISGRCSAPAAVGVKPFASAARSESPSPMRAGCFEWCGCAGPRCVLRGRGRAIARGRGASGAVADSAPFESSSYSRAWQPSDH